MWNSWWTSEDSNAPLRQKCLTLRLSQYLQNCACHGLPSTWSSCASIAYVSALMFVTQMCSWSPSCWDTQRMLFEELIWKSDVNFFAWKQSRILAQFIVTIMAQKLYYIKFTQIRNQPTGVVMQNLNASISIQHWEDVIGMFVVGLKSPCWLKLLRCN